MAVSHLHCEVLSAGNHFLAFSERFWGYELSLVSTLEWRITKILIMDNFEGSTIFRYLSESWFFSISIKRQDDWWFLIMVDLGRCSDTCSDAPKKTCLAEVCDMTCFNVKLRVWEMIWKYQPLLLVQLLSKIQYEQFFHRRAVLLTSSPRIGHTH